VAQWLQEVEVKRLDHTASTFPWKVIALVAAYAIFTWWIVRDFRNHEFPGAVVDLVLAAVFSLIAYKAMRSKSK
jgi:hypothetical protein